MADNVVVVVNPPVQSNVNITINFAPTGFIDANPNGIGTGYIYTGTDLPTVPQANTIYIITG